MKITKEEFKEQLLEELDVFIKNMDMLQRVDHKPGQPLEQKNHFPAWYRMFGRWLEIGTDKEGDYYDT